MSLRAKLFLLCFISLGVVITPIIYFTYVDVSRTTSHMEEAAFDRTASLVEDNIGQRYLNLLTQRVLEVLGCKSDLQKAASLARDLWNEISSEENLSQENKEKLAKACMAKMQELDASLAILQSTGVLFLGNDDLGLLTGIEQEVSDFKGRSLRGLLAEDNEFAVLSLPQSKGGFEPVLAFFLQVPEKHSVIVSLLRLSDLDGRLGEAMQRLIAETRSKLSTFEVYTHGFVTILDNRGNVLAHTGNELGRHPELFPPQAMALPTRKGTVKHVGVMPELGETLFSVLRFASLDWTVVVAAPVAELEAPTRTLVTKLIYMALGGIVLVLFLSLGAVVNLIRPLRLLTEKIRSLPDMDFASGETEEIIAKGLPTARKDEVGQVAEAFSRMGHKLSANIRDLMDTTAAKERMQGELNAARDIQLGILPPPDGAPREKGFTAAAFLEPAKEVGGDLYDFFTTPEGSQAVIIGDVSDKGVPAALFMSMAVILTRYALNEGLDPAAAMTRINNALSANNAQNMFVTLFIGLFDPATGRLDYANGGHCPPLVWSGAPGQGNGEITLQELTDLSGPVVGALPGLEYALHTATLNPDDVCLLYTDGVSEAIDEQGGFFGTDRIKSLALLSGEAPPERLLADIYAAVVSFRGKAAQSDDITLLAFKRAAEEPA